MLFLLLKSHDCINRKRAAAAEAEAASQADVLPGRPPLLWSRLQPPLPLAVQPSEFAWLAGGWQARHSGSSDGGLQLGLDPGLQAARDIIACGTQVWGSLFHIVPSAVIPYPVYPANCDSFPVVCWHSS